jgi:D-alanine-D-alanine ligase
MDANWNITVMLGGPSAEREVSLRSGAAVVRALRGRGHRVTELDPRTGSWTLPSVTEAVFLALHGTYGEDGTVQEQLEALGVPYTGSDARASRIAFDKASTKQRCVAANVPTPPFRVVESADTPWPEGWEAPLVVNPVCQGSSVGLRFVESRDSWSTALAEALRHDSRVLVEPRIEGRETTVGILGDEVLPIVEVCPKQGAYDYQNKYTAGATEYHCPAGFDEATTRRIQSAGREAFRAVGGRDYGRVDIMVTSGGEPQVLEVNTLPGMTETSLLPKAAAAAGISYEELCHRMVAMAVRRNSPAARLQGV